jgi:hypothetical protein
MTQHKNVFSLFAKSCVEHEVGGKTLNFYPISLPMLRKIRPMVGPFVKAMGVLFGSRTLQDVTVITQRSVNPESGREEAITQSNPLDQATLDGRAAARAKALTDAVEEVFSDRNFNTLASLLMDSLRDDCPRRPTPEEVQEFADQLDLQLAGEMLAGWWKASGRVFGDVGEKAAAMVKAKTKDALAAAQSPAPVPAQDELPRTES